MPKRQTITLLQKQAIQHEFKRRKEENISCDQDTLARWAQTAFKLEKQPGQSTISRIINDTPIEGTVGNRARRRLAQFPEFERALHDWVTAQFAARRAITGPLIIEAGRRLMNEMNAKLPAKERITITLSNGWLQNFQHRFNLRSLKSYGESGDGDQDAIDRHMERLKAEVMKFDPDDRFNADEFGLFYRMAPDRTIAAERLPGRKKEKTRITYLAGANATGSERIPLLGIGRARKPRCFKGKTGTELGFDYHFNSKAWMNSEIFKEWLGRFSSYIRSTSSTRKVLLLLDNASCHGNNDVLPVHDNVNVLFLPPNTTSKIQPMDAGIIASMKKRYRRFQYERALDNIDADVKNIYCIDQLQAMKKMNIIWKDLPNTVFWNCWLHTKIMDGVKMAPKVGETEQRLEEELTVFINQLVFPHQRQSGRIAVDSLLNFEGEDDDCVFEPSIECLAAVAVDAINAVENGDGNLEEEETLLEDFTLDDKLMSLVVVREVLREQGIESQAVWSALRRAQNNLKRDMRQTMRQTRLTSFFGLDSVKKGTQNSLH